MSITNSRLGKQGTTQGKYLRPPPLSGFDGIAQNAGQRGYQRSEEGKSLGEEGQYFQCNQSDIMQDQLIDTFQKPKQELAAPVRNQSKTSLRLQDQAIIVVEEEDELASNHGGGESIILQHIQFKNQPYENTPKWPHEHHRPHRDQHQPWINVDQENYTDSEQDFSSSQFKVYGVRKSKKTCIDRMENKDFQGNGQKNNKSCIAKPMSSAEDLEEDDDKKEGSGHFYNVRNIIGTYMPDNMQAYAQTDLSGKELLQNEQYLTEELGFMQGKVKGLQEEVSKWKQTSTEQSNQISIMKDYYAGYERNMAQFKEQNEKCTELERTIASQRRTIKEYEENSLQQIKQSKLSSTNLLSFSGHKNTTKILEYPLDNSHNSSLHQQCRKQIQQLQQYIFDIQQKMARVDLQIQLKVQLAKQELQKQIAYQYGKEYSHVIDGLKEDLNIQRHSNHKLLAEWSLKELQLKNKQLKISKMYDELVKQRQSIELQKQLKSKRQQQNFNYNYHSPKNRTRQRVNTEQSYNKSEISDHPLNFSKRQMTSDYKTTRTPIRNNSDFTQNIRFSLRDKVVPVTQVLSRTYAHQPSQEMREFLKGSSNQTQLYAINSKIQKLRSQITRELDSIH